MWGKGHDWNGIWGLWSIRGGLLADWLAGWGVETKLTLLWLKGPLLVLFTPLTINKRLIFPGDGQTLRNTHTYTHTHRLQHYIVVFGAVVSFSWPTGRGALGHLLDESGCWNARNLTCDLFTKHISSPYARHTLFTPRLREGSRRRDNMLTYSADEWPYQLFAHYWVICIS